MHLDKIMLCAVFLRKEKKMETIMLNDLLHIDYDSEDFKFGRITLNTGYEGVRYIDSWLKRNDIEDKYGPDFSFWANSSTNNKRYLKIGNEFVVVAIQLFKNDEWLLASICRITKINIDKPCEREPVEKYRKWFNRVIFKLSKSAQGYNFTLRTFIDRCEVIKVLDKPYGGKPFPGYFNINEKMSDLMNYLQNTNLGEDWKKELKAIKAVYCLNNHKEHKVYIGSAYNNNGCLLKRWEDYFHSLHGGNVELKKLHEEHGENVDYFLNNFYFSILEIFPNTVSDEYVLEREHHWMSVFDSRNPKVGYNRN